MGIGNAPAHHGELLQGMFDCAGGRPQRALVTLTHPQYGTRACFRPCDTSGVTVTDPKLIKARRAAELTLRELAGEPLAPAGGVVEIVSNIPHGVGMGSSTSDVTATIRAVADYHDVVLPQRTIARLAVLAEKAADSVMFDDAVVLFGHREGVVLETLGAALPPLVVVGCDTDPRSGGVDTLQQRVAEYHDREVAAFGVLRAALRRAVVSGDAALLGRVSTASARINQRFLPKPALDDLVDLCHRHGGCGVQVAHSGTVAGLMFDATRPGASEDAERCVSAVEDMGLPVTTVWRTAPAPVREEVRC
ncbi:GHMP family kinase ATP-binding protein [Micromonospora sagamiensis]|uniref:Threonine kinase n=1 Tax=Micromonospora sagamiensis TaxID=47875 RepID=A0A562WL67_9ACTN|nr:hypothetical protein [Micromonospora sagamiensis]TWJ31030.1 threonine kinase [Micromonospora sagamiensis]